MKFIFDFDNTLFRSVGFAEAIRQEFRECGVDDALFNETMVLARGSGSDWKPFGQVELLAGRGVASSNELTKRLGNVLAKAPDYLYYDTRSFLDTLRIQHPLFLLTYGEDQFQRAKVDASGITHYFKKVVITGNIKKDAEAYMLSENEPAVFIEDNPHALIAAKAYAPHITTVRILRGEGRYTDEPNGEGIDREIKNLEELLDNSN